MRSIILSILVLLVLTPCSAPALSPTTPNLPSPPTNVRRWWPFPNYNSHINIYLYTGPFCNPSPETAHYPIISENLTTYQCWVFCIPVTDVGNLVIEGNIWNDNVKVWSGSDCRGTRVVLDEGDKNGGCYSGEFGSIEAYTAGCDGWSVYWEKQELEGRPCEYGP